jgi:hypothetical protein
LRFRAFRVSEGGREEMRGNLALPRVSEVSDLMGGILVGRGPGTGWVARGEGC